MVKINPIIIGLGIGTAIGLISLGVYLNLKKGGSVGSKKIKNILFVGDSNTQANFSYADKIKKDFPNFNVKKISKNGENTTWMLKQLQDELASNKYDVIFLLSGSNDIYGGTPLDKTKENITEINRLIKKNGAISFIISPPNKDFYLKRTDANQKKLADLIDWEEKQNFDYFINFKNMTNSKSLFTDKDGYLHPQSHAHSMLEQEVIKKLNLS